MKDFYLRLGIFPSSGQGILVDAIDAHPNKTIQIAARAILLSSSKRAQYDAAHAQLKRIAQLRSNLGLRRSELWTDCNVDDFDVAPRGHHSQLQALRESVARTQPREHGPTQASGDWTPQNIRKAAAIVVGLVLLVWWILPSDRSNNSAATQSYSETVNTPPHPESTGHRPTYGEVFGNRPPTKSTPATPRMTDPRSVVNEVPETPVPLPRTGALTARCKYRSDRPELRTTSGPDSGNFFVKLYVFGTSTEKCRAFVRNGETASLSLPAGRYEVRYGSGLNWYGEELKFGSETSASKGVDPIELSVISVPGGMQLMGGELILEKQIDGNFPDRIISATEL